MARFVVLLLLGLALPAVASAAVIVERDTGGVPANVAGSLGMSAAERQALDVDSVQATGQEGLAMIVELRFRGSVERRLGRGAVRRAGIELVLHHESGARSVMKMRGAIDNQSSRHRTSFAEAGAVRDRATVKFILRGGGFSGVTQAEVHVFSGAAGEADRAGVQVRPFITAPAEFECDEVDRMYDDLTDATAALDRQKALIEARERAVPPHVQDTLALVLGLGGQVELIHGQIEC
jgi:hypothetical protein